MGKWVKEVLQVKKTSFPTLFLSQTQQRVKELRRLPVRGITAKEVLALWREGRLYLKETETACKQDIQDEVRAYVGAIHEYVAPEWQSHIADIWQSIVKDEAFASMMVMRKGRMRGRLNRYAVTNIVFHLKALDIYQCDSLLELHKRLEGVERKNSIYKSAGMYALSRAQRLRLRELKNFWSGLK